MDLPLLTSADVSGKTLLLRADLDIPLANGEIIDDMRLLAGLPTIEYLLKHGAKVIVAGHAGRPKGVDTSLSLEPIAKWLQSHLESLEFSRDKLRERSQGDFSPAQRDRNDNRGIEKMGEFDGWRITDKLFVLENLRFYEEERANDPEFAKKLASLADIYVNDAFGVTHRENASIVGVPKLLPHYGGFRLQEEVAQLSTVLQNPKRPLVILVGGAKIETKLPLVEKMHSLADFVLVGGKIAQETKTLLTVQHEKRTGKKSILLVAGLLPSGLDITSTSTENFKQVLAQAKTIVWNGPMGKTESDDTERASREIAQAIVESNAYKIVGGGDTLEFIRKIGLTDKFDFCSTGGGAMLAFLSGEKLPGLGALLTH